jgi:hypothetical protein
MSPTLLERAYQLARTGDCRGSADIRLRLKAERFSSFEVNSQISGASIIKALNRLCREARASNAPPAARS